MEVKRDGYGIGARVCPHGQYSGRSCKTLLGKIDSVRRRRERGFNPEKETRQTSRKFTGRVENSFNNLPEQLEWLTFYRHDLIRLILGDGDSFLFRFFREATLP